MNATVVKRPRAARLCSAELRERWRPLRNGPVAPIPFKVETRAKAKQRVKPIAALALAALAAFAAASAEAKRPADELADGILKHVRESLPPTWSFGGTGAERVRYFATLVQEFSVYPMDAPKLLAAANAAIDAANGPAATPDSLVGAAIKGAVASLRSFGKTPCEQCQPAAGAPPSLPTSVQVGTIRVVSFPNLNMPELVEHKPCSALDHYLDFPAEGVSGVVLDLRGNQGGHLNAVGCLAGGFLAPGTPLFRLVEKGKKATTIKTASDGKATPIALPLVVFIDRDTDSGGLMFAAALKDTGRASLIGEPKQVANGSAWNVFWTPNRQDVFELPVAYLQRIGGAPLAAGVQVDVTVSPASDDDALMEAARARLAAEQR